jgi:hypothetical protein
MLALKKCFEVTVLLVILGVSSHKGSMSSLLVLVGGFCLVLRGWLSSRILYHHTQSLAFMGFNGWKNLVSLHFVHLGIGLFAPLMVSQWFVLFLLGPVFTLALWLFN